MKKAHPRRMKRVCPACGKYGGHEHDCRFFTKRKRTRNPSSDFTQALVNTGIAAAIGGALGFAGRSVLGGASGGSAYAIAAGAGWATGLTALGALIVALADKPKREVGLETAGVSFGASILLGLVGAVAFTNAAVANVQPAPAPAQLPVSPPSTTV